jgi:hypothetical protein
MDIMKIEIAGKGTASAKINLYWANEGYEGIQTFHFSLIKEVDKWLIDWIVY